MDSAVILDAVGEVIRERLAGVDRAIAAARVTRVEQSGTRALLIFGDGSTHTLELPSGARGDQGERGVPGAEGARGEVGARGETGARGEIGERGERGVPGEPGPQGVVGERGERGEPGPVGERGEQGVPGVQGERGEHGEPGTKGEAGDRGERGVEGADGIGIASVEQSEGEAAFTFRLTDGTAVDIELPRGEPGESGPQGEPGRDRFIAAPRQVHEGERVEKNDLVAWGGGIVQAIRATNRTPGDDPASYVCIVAGIESLEMVENLGTRTFDITARLTNGIEHVVRARAMPRFMADGPRPGEKIIRGDQFVRGDWLFSATADGADPANIEAGGWRRQNIRGKRGEEGERGAQGERGVGIDDMTLDDDGVLTVKLTSGEEKLLLARAAA